MRLYGICRQVGYCVATCGLCAHIQSIGSRATPPPPPRQALPSRNNKHCDLCGMVKRSNHNCKALRPPTVARLRQLPRAKPVKWANEQSAACGCLYLGAQRVKYCNKHFAERE